MKRARFTTLIFLAFPVRKGVGLVRFEVEKGVLLRCKSLGTSFVNDKPYFDEKFKVLFLMINLKLKIVKRVG